MKPKVAAGSGAKKQREVTPDFTRSRLAYIFLAENPPKNKNKKQGSESECYTDDSDDEGSEGYRKGD